MANRRLRIWNNSWAGAQCRIGPKVSFHFKWYDLWIGCFVERSHRLLFICPLPCCVIRIDMKTRANSKWW